MAGKIGLTNKESGVRGAWVEKRVALFKSLQQHGHSILCLSDLTDETAAKGFASHKTYKQCDVLILEFGGTNLQFYQKYWDETIAMVKAHKGRIIFINDDPDLPFLWNLLPDEDWTRWTIAANATNVNNVSTILKCPYGTRVVDYPMNANMPFAEFHNGNLEKAVYIGRPNGRTKYFQEFLKLPQLQVAGKPAEWDGWNTKVVENPPQRLRRKFYRQYNACLAVYDDKHKSAGWRTGRAYHALYAGIPVLAPPGNPGLNWCYPVETAIDIADFVRKSKAERMKIWEMQKTYVEKQGMVDLINL